MDPDPSIHAILLSDDYDRFIHDPRPMYIELRRLLPSSSLHIWNRQDPNQRLMAVAHQVQFIIAWEMSLEEIKQFPNLRAVIMHSSNPHTPKVVDAMASSDVHVIKWTNDDVNQGIACYVMHWVTHYSLRMDEYAKEQRHSNWMRTIPFRDRKRYNVAVVGFGQLGQTICRFAKYMGYNTSAWSRKPVSDDQVRVFAEEDLNVFLSNADAVVNCLRRSSENKLFFNSNTFKKFKKCSIFINVCSGSCVNTESLVEFLDTGHLRAGVLDVFQIEPLPRNNVLWTHPKIKITPHVAGQVASGSCARFVAENVVRVCQGKDPISHYDRSRGSF